jgi:site-specific DNA-methyltransferase (adenine-specific)
MFDETRYYPDTVTAERGETRIIAPVLPDSLLHGDCLEVMRGIASASIDLIVTDPPYLVRYKSRDGRSIANDDNDRWLIPAFLQMARVLKDNSFCVSFYGWNKVDSFMAAWKQAGLTPVGHFSFNKPYASSTLFNQSCHENAYLLAKGRPAKPEKPIRDTLGWKYTGNRLHPTQKPVELLQILIQTFSKAGDVVLDPFAGSASTAIAAINAKRRFIAIEKDADYYAVASDRVNYRLNH